MSRRYSHGAPVHVRGHLLPPALASMLADGVGGHETRVIPHELVPDAPWLGLRAVEFFPVEDIEATTVDWCWRARSRLAASLKLATRFSRATRGRRRDPAWLDMDHAVIVGIAGPPERDQVLALDFSASSTDPAVRASRVLSWGSYERWHTVTPSLHAFLDALTTPAAALAAHWPTLAPTRQLLLASVAFHFAGGGAVDEQILRRTFERLCQLHPGARGEAWEGSVRELTVSGLIRTAVGGGVDTGHLPHPWLETLQELVRPLIAGAPGPGSDAGGVRPVASRSSA